MRQQVLAIEAASRAPDHPVGEDVFAFLMDMGTGKSKVVLDEWGQMATSGGPEDLLVFGPAASYKNWFIDKSELNRSEINTHVDPAFRERMLVAGWMSGGGAENKKLLEYMLRTREKNRPRALFVNIEAMSTVDKAIDLCREFVSQRFCYVAVDESTTIKSHSSSRYKSVSKIGDEAAVKRILTGLLTPQGPMDAYAQMNFLHWKILGYKSFYPFRSRYAVLRKMESGGRRFDVVVGYQNQEELTEKIGRYSYRVLKADCLDLEPKQYLPPREVQQTPEQVRICKELKTQASTQLASGDHASAQHAMTLVMMMHQVNCGIIKDENGNEHEVPTRRYDALVEVLQEHSGKAVVWVPYRRALANVVERLKKEFGKNCVAQFHGGNKNWRGEDEKRFLSDPECRYMVSTQAAGMRGNTWVVADLNVYFANTHDLEHRDQSEDRTHRKGQKRTVSYIDLVCPGTVDVKILTALRKKIDIATAIQQEGYRKWVI